MRKVSGFEATDGSLHTSKSDAVAADLMGYLMDTSADEVEISPLVASYMVASWREFSNVLCQMRPDSEPVLGTKDCEGEIEHLVEVIRYTHKHLKSYGGQMTPIKLANLQSVLESSGVLEEEKKDGC